MFELMCVTNRHLCQIDFLEQIERIARSDPSGIILREKDLPEAEYKELAGKVMEICQNYKVPCILHNFVDVAVELGAKAIHLPMPVLRRLADEQKLATEQQLTAEQQLMTKRKLTISNRHTFTTIGASCHSVEEAKEAQRLGCTYITAGHIFSTDCKKNVPPRGLDFLKEVCNAVTIPVYAIGGIDLRNIPLVRQAGAAGGCIMSGFMRCHELQDLLEGDERYEVRQKTDASLRSDRPGVGRENESL